MPAFVLQLWTNTAKTNCSLNKNFQLKLMTTLHQKYKCHVRQQSYYCLSEGITETCMSSVLADSARAFRGLVWVRGLGFEKHWPKTIMCVITNSFILLLVSPKLPPTISVERHVCHLWTDPYACKLNFWKVYIPTEYAKFKLRQLVAGPNQKCAFFQLLFKMHYLEAIQYHLLTNWPWMTLPTFQMRCSYRPAGILQPWIWIYRHDISWWIWIRANTLLVLFSYLEK